MDDKDLEQNLAFLRRAEKLKDVLRTAYTSGGKRESTAEHTWRLCLMAMVFEDAFTGIDFTKLLKMCVLHDLGEAISGDIPAIHQKPGIDKSAQERRDFQDLTGILKPELQARFLALWDEYEGAASPEAVMAKGLDKLETILQHNQGKNPPDFDYGFNLGYGQKHTARHPLLAAIRQILDRETAAHAAASDLT
jgi:putative hydrolase of HD superfamily